MGVKHVCCSVGEGWDGIYQRFGGWVEYVLSSLIDSMPRGEKRVCWVLVRRMRTKKRAVVVIVL
jgi:hypothetical protein